MIIKKRSITSILFLLLAFGIRAQENSVQVIINVIPPYSHQVNDYIDNNRILVSLQYNSFNPDTCAVAQ